MGFIKKLLGTLGDLLTSKKVVTTAATIVLGKVVQDPALRDNIIHTGMVLVGAQGAADLGKYAKQALGK